MNDTQMKINPPEDKGGSIIHPGLGWARRESEKVATGILTTITTPISSRPEPNVDLSYK